MKEHPILSQAEMVRALLAGRKTQTRRTVKDPLTRDAFCQKVLDITETPNAVWKFEGDAPTNYGGEVQMNDWEIDIKCPFGVPGEHLWVKETFFDARYFKHEPLFAALDVDYIYAADYEYREKKRQPSVIASHPWKPSIFMPRKASRITLEITNVRVERLQDISEADAVAEGVTINVDAGIASEFLNKSISPAQLEYFALWEKINGKGSWAKNPWVWCLIFKRV